MDSPALIAERLAVAYPDAHCELLFSSPFELLVATVLSAQSTDRRVNEVTPKLFDAFPEPAALALAELSVVEEIIKPVGFFRNKASSIVGLSQRLVDDFCSVVPNTLEELITLPGVGRKTANVVLGNAFGVPGVTPDTHLIRLSNRFGWVESKNPDIVERKIMELFPPARWTQLCHEVIWHGRRVCHARKPACGACVLSSQCPSFGLGEIDPEKAALLVKEPRK